MKPWEKYSTSIKPWERYSAPKSDTTTSSSDWPSMDNIVKGNEMQVIKGPEDAPIEPSLPVIGGVQSTVANLAGEAAANLAMESTSQVIEGTDFQKEHPTLAKGLEIGTGLAAAIATGGPKNVNHFEDFGSMSDDAIQAVADDLADPISNKGLRSIAKLVAHKEGTSPEEVLKRVEHLPTVEDKTIGLAMGTSDKKFINHFKEAIRDNDILTSHFQDEVITRKDIIASLGQHKEELKEASKKWDEMLDLVNKEPVSYSLEGIAKDVDYIDTLYGTMGGKSATTINKLKKAAEEGATITLGDALELRKGVNRLIRKAPTGTSDIERLKNLNKKIESFINTVTKDKPELKTLIDKTTEYYARVINNVRLTGAVKSSTTFKHGEGALDYTKLLDKIDKLGLKSPEVAKAVDIAKKFENKYKLDKYLGDIIVPKGAGPGGFGYVGYGSILRWLMDHTPYNRFFNRSRFKSLAIQENLRKAIEKSKTIWDFLDRVKADAKVPNDMKAELETILNDAKRAMEVKKIEYKPGTIPLYATKEGTIGKDASKVNLVQAQKNMVRDALDKGYNDNVVEAAHKNLFKTKRIDNIVNNVRTKLKADDKAHNIRVVKNIITSEAKALIKKIENDVGVKMPTSEAEKLIKMKLDDMMKDCK